MTLVFTICSNNYLAQAVSLGRSLLDHNPDYIFKIGLVDQKDISIDYNRIPYEIIEVETIGIEELKRMVLRYNIQELNTAVKPFYFNYFINKSDSFDRIIYLDPDILVYRPFTELRKELDTHNIIITPHITEPINDNKMPSENAFLNTGIYNLGFMAINVSSTAKRMIEWWAERLKDKGYNDVKNGMFTDQLWINFVPLYFPEVKIFTHPGYNMAYWNLQERVISKRENAFYVNDDKVLVFFHFSGFSLAESDTISKYQNRFTFSERSDILPLFQEYARILESNNYSYFRSFKCHFSGIKDLHDENAVLKMVKQIPIYKRIIKIIINHIIKKYNILLDYRIFYERKNLEDLKEHGK